jgi:mycothiol synthase
MQTWPDGLLARPLTKDDMEPLAELMAAAERVDRTEEHYGAEDLLEQYEIPDMRPETDTVGLWSGDRLVAHAVLRSAPGQQEVAKVHGSGTVHPEWRRRGIGTALLTWMGRQGVDLWQARHPDLPGELHIGSIDTNADLLAILGKAGFEEARYWFDMKVELGSTPSPNDPPEGLRLAAFEPAYDEATRIAHNEAFQDHWGSNPTSAELWKAEVTGSRTFRAAMSYLVLDGDEVAAYALGYEYEADTAVTGIRDLYVGQVGTRRAYRGRGLARTVLAASLEAAAKDGFQTSTLGVDSTNPTGALGLYESLGYRVTHRWITHRRALRVATT